MKRREALSALGLITGAVAIGPGAFLSSCSEIDREAYQGILTRDQLDLLNGLGELILPKTQTTPGAAEAKVAEFANVIVTEYFNEAEQASFLSGFQQLETQCETLFGKRFSRLDEAQQTELLTTLEQEAGTALKAIDPAIPRDEIIFPPYVVMKQLVIWGFLSSEVVAKTAFEWAPIPGRWDPCQAVAPGDKTVFGGSSSGQGLGYATYHMRRG